MDNFAAIDFETANEQRTSVCSVGIVIVKNREIVDKIYELIQPEPNYYKWYNTAVHGLTQEDTENAPVFPKVWEKIAPKIEGLPLVAHNKAFDESCLKAVFRCYRMDYPDYEFYCTLKQSRTVWKEGKHTLDVIAERCGYDLSQHHHALADAEACAAIALKIFTE
ncbi:MAG: 3'-5' exonuclease [Bacteroidales bacterium]|nr:3'-5' exonuclease [Bacteroidales bacterium]